MGEGRKRESNEDDGKHEGWRVGVYIAMSKTERAVISPTQLATGSKPTALPNPAVITLHGR